MQQLFELGYLFYKENESIIFYPLLVFRLNEQNMGFWGFGVLGGDRQVLVDYV